MACTIMSTLSIFFKYQYFFLVLPSAFLLKVVIVFIPNSKEEKNEQRLNSGDHDWHRFPIMPDSTPIALLVFSVAFIVEAGTT